MFPYFSRVRRTLVNHHKLKRTWGRRAKRLLAPRSSRLGNTAVHGKDYAWGGETANPFHRRNAGFFRRKKIELFLLFTSVSAMAWFLLFHPFFRVRSVEFTGLERISSDRLKEAIAETMAKKKLFYLPADSYLMVDVRDIHDTVAAGFPVASLEIEKRFPDTLHVAVQEKISTVIYCAGAQCAYLGLDGRLVELLPVDAPPVSSDAVLPDIISADELTRRFGRYPVVYGGKGIAAGERLMTPETVRCVIDWFHLLEKRSDVPFRYMTLGGNAWDASVHTSHGLELLVRLDEPAAAQFERFTALRGGIDGYAGVQYIDLRYGSKVFWQ